jgi:hypothetical protein
MWKDNHTDATIQSGVPNPMTDDVLSSAEETA